MTLKEVSIYTTFTSAEKSTIYINPDNVSSVTPFTKKVFNGSAVEERTLYKVQLNSNETFFVENYTDVQ